MEEHLLSLDSCLIDMKDCKHPLSPPVPESTVEHEIKRCEIEQNTAVSAEIRRDHERYRSNRSKVHFIHKLPCVLGFFSVQGVSLFCSSTSHLKLG